MSQSRVALFGVLALCSLAAYAGTPYGGTPSPLPGTLEAENFDEGGEGAGYHDLTSGNSGRQYRTQEDVDIVASADGQGGGYVVNNFQSGEWLAYTVNLPAAANYDIAIRAANNYASGTPTFHVEVDGVNVTGSVAVPRTGSWSSFQWVEKQGISLGAGAHVLKLVADAQYFDVNQLRVQTSAVQPPVGGSGSAGTPYSGTPVALPATLEAENFDRGGEGVGYHDRSAGNAGRVYRTGEDVDLIVSGDSAGGGYVVNNFQSGEWLAYTVSVASAGSYDFFARVANKYKGTPAFHIEVDGVNVTGSIAAPRTSSWSRFVWAGKTGIPLSAGTHVLKFVSDAEYFDVNQLRVSASAGGGATGSTAKAVPTFEAMGLYWTPPSAPASGGCDVQYRKSGDTAWKSGLALWYDARNKECRGSLVYLTPGTSYDMQISGGGQSTTLTASTWSENFPIAGVVTVPAGATSFAITQGGSPSGYVVYTGGPIDAANGQDFNLSINASYVIVRGMTLKGAQRDAIRIQPGVHDVVIEDNDISGWGRYDHTNLDGWQVGMDHDSGIAALCGSTPSVSRVVIQRNRIHHPRYGANSWSDGHPYGPQPIFFSQCGGNHVFRHNEIYSGDVAHYFKDGIGGEDNFSSGFPNADSDIYGNRVQNVWDDAVEAEGADRNVRIWGNYFDSTTTGVASTAVGAGPIYIFRNVYNRSRQLYDTTLDGDDRNVFAKSGTTSQAGGGRRYILHNTLLQAAPPAGTTYSLGAGGGIRGTGSTQPVTNTVSRNNIFHIWKAWWASYDQIGSGNDFAYDLYSGTANGITIANGLQGAPTYADGNGPTSESGGMYQLAPGTAGYDQGARIPNFNDGFLGAAPDIGAHEGGSGRMLFGVAAGSGGQ
jgi:hypothetical protein